MLSITRLASVVRLRPVSIVRHRLSRVHIATMSNSSSDPQTTSIKPEGPVAKSIREKLTSTLRPTELNIVNDSWQHRHHAAMRAEGGGNGETHFSIQVVSEEFRGKTTMQRHRIIYSALSDELSQGLHALSLKTKTPEETQKPQA